MLPTKPKRHSMKFGRDTPNSQPTAILFASKASLGINGTVDRRAPHLEELDTTRVHISGQAVHLVWSAEMVRMGVAWRADFWHGTGAQGPVSRDYR